MTTSEFVKKYNGKSVDFDNYAGGQCVDLMRFYIRDVLACPQPLAVTGAKDFWFNYSKDLNLKNCYQQIKNTSDGIPQEGDIIIWDKWKGNPYGHVAICLNGSLNSFDSIDQNFDGKLITQIVKHNYLNPPVLGWLRAKQLMNFIDLKKRLNDTNWAELDEFNDLEKLGLIERADSIQTMTMKWLKSNSDLVIKNAELKETEAELLKTIDDVNEDLRIMTQRKAELDSVVSERDKMVTTLTNEINGLKNDLVALQEDADDDDKLIIDLQTERRLLELKIEGLQGEPTFSQVIDSLVNLLKKWLKI